MSGNQKCAFGHRGKLGPGNVGIHCAKARECAKTAIGPCHDPIAPEYRRETFETLSHEAGVFDKVRRRVNYPWNKDLVGRYFGCAITKSSHSWPWRGFAVSKRIFCARTFIRTGRTCIMSMSQTWGPS